MKILKNNIDSFRKELTRIKYQPMFGNSVIVFAIDKSKTRNMDGISLEINDKKFGSEKTPDPVLVLQQETRENVKDSSYVLLGFADLTFGRKFDFVQYCELANCKISKKQEALFDNVECYLVDKNSILMAVDF